MAVLKTYLTRDDVGEPIQVLPCRPNGGWVAGLAAAAPSKLIGPFPQNTYVIRITAVATAILFQLGIDDTITVAVPPGDFMGNGPHYLAAGASIDVAIASGAYQQHSFLAVISANGTAGTVYVSERG